MGFVHKVDLSNDQYSDQGSVEKVKTQEVNRYNCWYESVL